MTDDLVGDVVRLAPHAARALDADGNAPQILDQYEAQDRGQGPQLADLERIVLLKALDYRGDALARNRAVCVGDVEPG
ncbi:hypothetical protein D3C87_1787700 [compost metagenome]